MKRRSGYAVLILLIAVLLQGCSFDKLYQMQHRQRATTSFKQIDFKDLADRYFLKDHTSVGTMEGIYSVSVLIVKKGKGMLSSTEKEKTVERRENYSKVAIIRDTENASRGYIEVSMDKDFLTSFSIIGEFTHAADGPILVYKHFDAKGKSTAYTFTYDQSSDILEGIRTENSGSFTYTYKLTYLKLSPKVNSLKGM